MMYIKDFAVKLPAINVVYIDEEEIFMRMAKC